MKAELESQDIEAIAQRVAELLKPILAHRKDEAEDTIFDVQGLSQYLKTSKKWVYEQVHLKRIPYLKVNGLLRFRKKAIDKWLESNKVSEVPVINSSLSIQVKKRKSKPKSVLTIRPITNIEEFKKILSPEEFVEMLWLNQIDIVQN